MKFLTTVEEIEHASLENLLYTWRYAPVGVVDNLVMSRIGEIISDVQERDPGHFTHVSKLVGWSR